MIREYHLRFLRELLLPAIRGGQRILEIGCGPDGELARLLAQRGPRALRIVGIDRTLQPVESEDAGVRLLRMDASSLDLPDGSFDVVYSLATFEHILNLDRVLEEARRVLVPGGWLVAKWSPVWSGFNGHHYGRSVTGNEWESDILLPWAQHLFDPEGLADYLVRGESFAPEEAARTSRFVLESAALNRFWRRDYERVLDGSGLEIVSLDSGAADMANLASRARATIDAGALDAVRLDRFFATVPPDEYRVYRMQARLRRGR